MPPRPDRRASARAVALVALALALAVVGGALWILSVGGPATAGAAGPSGSELEAGAPRAASGRPRAGPERTRLDEPPQASPGGRSPGPPAEAPPEGDVFAILAWIEGHCAGRSEVLPLARDANRFGELLERGTREHWVDGRPHTQRLDREAEDGTVLRLEAGVWRLDGSSLPAVLPRDLTIAGAGLDATLLVLGGITTGARVRRFELRDCTVQTEDRPLLKVQGELASLVFERVRFVGFDSGLGGSALLEARGLAVLFRECRFEGGSGLKPGSGRLFALAGPALLARFERCRLDWLALDWETWSPCAGVVFAGSRLTQMVVADPAALARSSPANHPRHPGAFFGDSTVMLLGDGRGSPADGDLERHFPGWRGRAR